MRINFTGVRFHFLLACTLFFIVGAAVAESKQCDSQCLRNISDAYIHALLTHDLKNLPLADAPKFTENGQSLKMTAGLWKTMTKVGGYRENFVDAVSGNALIVATVEEDGAPAILAARLRIATGKITEIETIVARKGSHPLFTPELLTVPDVLFTQSLSKEKRASRARMIAVANTYFDGIERNSSKNILATDECDRFENGSKTTHRAAGSGGCAQSADAINYIKAVKDRRFFIVDEATGVVACTIVFDIPGNETAAPSPTSAADAQLAVTLRKARMLLLTEIFKIEDGKIQRIQAVMHNLPHGAGSGWEK